MKIGAEQMNSMYERIGLTERVVSFGNGIEALLKGRFEEIDRMAEYNQLKVLSAMQESKVDAECFNISTGYGYDDPGREKTEKTYALAFHTEDALVRPQITCGTHALALALLSNLRPGQTMLSASGKPYDTLEEVIGIRPSRGSLAEYGIHYREVALLPDGSFDFDGIGAALQDETVHLVEIQRSKGYQTRRTLSVDDIGSAVSFIKARRPDVVVMVDNCYGEFVEDREPSDVGADMTVGSLIKNPGGGLASSGGYIAGTRECIENAAARLTAPGLGKEVGASLGQNRAMLQGFFLAPTVTAAALKGAIFCANIYERLGFSCIPDKDEERHDIIQAVTLRTPEALCAFAAGLQAGSAVDSYVTPEPWDMPGYDDKVIMAAGTFVQGSSIELSGDGPLRAPYAVYLQGGLTWPAAKAGILMSLQKLCDADIVHDLPLC